MENWYQCVVRYKKMDVNGKEKTVTESYIVDALSFTEVEARINEELEKLIGEGFTVRNITKSQISEIVENEYGGEYFKCKVQFVNIDDKTGREKNMVLYVLVESENLEDVPSIVSKMYDTMMTDWRLVAIQDTNIADVFHYTAKDN